MEQITTPSQPNQKLILVDVFSWVAATAKLHHVPMEGVWRVAEHFCRQYTPALFFISGEFIDPEAVKLLQTYLGKEILIMDQVSEVNACCRVWLSIAVDFPSPYIGNPIRKACTVAIIHDDLCARGVFGEQKRKLYVYGATNNDAFLYTTETAWSAFAKHNFSAKIPRFVLKIGCPHTFPNWDTVVSNFARRKGRLPSRSLFGAVHSVYPRKNLTKEALVADWMGYGLVHAGKVFDSSQDDLFGLMTAHGATMLGELTPAELGLFYRRMTGFICLSSDEGFSIPAMEAILYGVPDIWLSDIPAHREVYGQLPINWVDLNLPYHTRTTMRRTVSLKDARVLWETYHPDTLQRTFTALETL